MRSTFWPNRIFERQSSQNRQTGLKFSPNRENSALLHKLLYKTLFSGYAQHVLPKSHFWASKFSKSSLRPEILAKKGKQCASHENCTKRSLRVMRSTFWPNRIDECQNSQNRHPGQFQFSPKREKQCAFSWKIVQNALFRSMCSTFWPNRIFERQSSQNRHFGQKFSSKKQKQCDFDEKVYKNDLFRSCRERFGQIAFVSVKVLKNRHTGLKFSPKRENRAFYENLYKNALFQVMRSTFLAKIAFCER